MKILKICMLSALFLLPYLCGTVTAQNTTGGENYYSNPKKGITASAPKPYYDTSVVNKSDNITVELVGESLDTTPSIDSTKKALSISGFHDNTFTRRIQLNGRGLGSDYFDAYYTDLYWYTGNPYYWGPSIYYSWDPWFSPHWNGWYHHGWGGSYWQLSYGWGWGPYWSWGWGSPWYYDPFYYGGWSSYYGWGGYYGGYYGGVYAYHNYRPGTQNHGRISGSGPSGFASGRSHSYSSGTFGGRNVGSFGGSRSSASRGVGTRTSTVRRSATYSNSNGNFGGNASSSGSTYTPSRSSYGGGSSVGSGGGGGGSFGGSRSSGGGGGSRSGGGGFGSGRR